MYIAHQQSQQQEPDVAHERLVLSPPHMLLLPASVAEVVEAGEVPGSKRMTTLPCKASYRSVFFNVAPLKKVLRVSEFTYQHALKILGGWGDSYNKTSLEQGNPN